MKQLQHHMTPSFFQISQYQVAMFGLLTMAVLIIAIFLDFVKVLSGEKVAYNKVNKIRIFLRMISNNRRS